MIFKKSRGAYIVPDIASFRFFLETRGSGEEMVSSSLQKLHVSQKLWARQKRCKTKKIPMGQKGGPGGQKNQARRRGQESKISKLFKTGGDSKETLGDLK